MTADIRAGWTHFWHHALLRRVAFISAAINFFGAATCARGKLRILGLSTNMTVALVGMFCAAVATSCNQIVVSTLRQAAVADNILGRVTAAYRLIVLGVVPFGALAGGVLGHAFGIRAPFLAAALGLTLAAVLLASRVTTAALRQAETDNAHPTEVSYSP